MLVLSRKPNETILLRISGVEVELYVVEITRGRVKLGVTAPMEVIVTRGEMQTSDTARIRSNENDSQPDHSLRGIPPHRANLAPPR